MLHHKYIHDATSSLSFCAITHWLLQLQFSVCGTAWHHLSPFRRAMNTAIRLVTGLGPRDAVMTAMRELHWLPIGFLIKYKLCRLMHVAVNGFCQEYISKVLIPVSILSGHIVPCCGLLHPVWIWCSMYIRNSEKELYRWLDLRHEEIYKFKLLLLYIDIAINCYCC